MEKDTLSTRVRTPMENVTNVSTMVLTLTTTAVVLITITLGKVTLFTTVVPTGATLLEELDTQPTTTITRVTPGLNIKHANCIFISCQISFIYFS